jgi:hypothetical protein
MKKVKEQLIAWLAEEDYEVSVESPPKEAPVEWMLRVTSKVPVRVNIIIQQPRGKEGQLVASLGVVISEQHYQGLMSLPEKERALIVYEIVRDLTLACPECLVIVQPSLVDMQRLVVTRTLFVDELTREKVSNTIRVLVNMFSLLSLRLSASIGPLPTQKRELDKSMGFM